MNTLKWLIKREYWEHKGSFLWAPLAVGSFMVLMTGGSLLYKMLTGATQGGPSHDVVEHAERLSDVIGLAYLALSAPLLALLTLAVFNYAANCLSSERQDRSILFWKSLPVSDGESVLAKSLSALLLMPVVSVATAAVSSALLIVIIALALSTNGAHLLGPLFSTAGFYLTPLQMLCLLPVYIVVALPTIGWLMLVSSWARSKAALWAIGIPLVATAALKILDNAVGLGWDVDAFLQNVLLRGLFGVAPGYWFSYDKGALQAVVHNADGAPPAVMDLVQASWHILSLPGPWIGAAVGLLMLFGAVRMRRFRDEA